jgi:membrane protease subunit HflK
MINQANGEYNKVVPRASGEAQRLLSDAEGYAIRRVNEAEGDATRFKALLGQYEQAPDVTRRRLYLETMGELLPKLGGTVVIDEDARQFLPLMNLPPAAARSAAP